MKERGLNVLYTSLEIIIPLAVQAGISNLLGNFDVNSLVEGMAGSTTSQGIQSFKPKFHRGKDNMKSLTYIDSAFRSQILESQRRTE